MIEFIRKTTAKFWLNAQGQTTTTLSTNQYQKSVLLSFSFCFYKIQDALTIFKILHTYTHSEQTQLHNKPVL